MWQKIVAKCRKQMKFCNSHLTCNIFNLYMQRFFFGLVYAAQYNDVKIINVNFSNL